MTTLSHTSSSFAYASLPHVRAHATFEVHFPPREPPNPQSITNIKSHYIEFNYWHDHYQKIAIQQKFDKHTPLIATITTSGWLIQPPIVLIASRWGGLHTPTFIVYY